MPSHNNSTHAHITATDQAIIALDGVSVCYGPDCALRDASLTVAKGDFVAITGPNGGGKTTLLKVILQLVKPTSGHVTFKHDGHEVKSLEIGYLPQKNAIDPRYPITVEEVIASGMLGKKKIWRRIDSSDRARVDETLELIGLSDMRRHSIGTLSGGQLQRALLGRAVISNPPVLAMDEPLSYVDKQFEPRLYEIIRQLSQNATILLVSHEMTEISAMANKHVIVDRTMHICHANHHFFRSECD